MASSYQFPPNPKTMAHWNRLQASMDQPLIGIGTRERLDQLEGLKIQLPVRIERGLPQVFQDGVAVEFTLGKPHPEAFFRHRRFLINDPPQSDLSFLRAKRAATKVARETGIPQVVISWLQGTSNRNSDLTQYFGFAPARRSESADQVYRRILEAKRDRFDSGRLNEHSVRKQIEDDTYRLSRWAGDLTKDAPPGLTLEYVVRP
jgi:hypothetical protein